jgi:hypothetical protein
LSRFLQTAPAHKTNPKCLYRDRSRTHLQHPIAGLRLGHLSTLYRDTRLIQLTPAMTAKTRAIPSLHRDNFLAKVPGPGRCSRRVTQPPFIAGPLAVINLTFSK